MPKFKWMQSRHSGEAKQEENNESLPDVMHLGRPPAGGGTSESGNQV